MMKNLNEWAKKHKVSHGEIVYLLIYVLEMKAEDKIDGDEVAARYGDMLDDLYNLQ